MSGGIAPCYSVAQYAFRQGLFRLGGVSSGNFFVRLRLRQYV